MNNKERVLKYISKNKENIIPLIQKMIKVNTVLDLNTVSEKAPYGKNILEGLKDLENIVLEQGQELIIAKNNKYAYVTECEPGTKILDFLCHYDTVPVDLKTEGDWITGNGFDPVISNNAIYGRGSLDDKGSIAIYLFIKKMFDHLQIDLPFEFRMFVGLDEETTQNGQKDFLKDQPKSVKGIVPDGFFPICYGEKSIMNIDLQINYTSKLINSIDSSKIINSVPAKCTTCIKLPIGRIKDEFDIFSQEEEIRTTIEKCKDNPENTVITIKGFAAHGAYVEQGKNAITYLFKFLNIFQDNDHLSKFIGTILHNDFNGKNFDISSPRQDVESDTTVNLGIIEKNSTGYLLKMNIRYINTEFDDQTIIAKLENYLNVWFKDYAIKILSLSTGYIYEKNMPFITNFMEVYKEITNDNESTPYYIGGGTYARHFNNTFCIGPLTTNYGYKAHCVNENFPIDSIYKALEIYSLFILKLADKPELL